MARGGRRSGTVGTVYGQRTDLNVKRNLDTGYTPPAPASPAQPNPEAVAEQQGVHPDEVTPMFAPTDRPGEPVTAGLPMGPGPGPAAPPSPATQALARHLPWLVAAANADPDTPVSVLGFINMLQSQATR